nr:glycosyltransferase family 4 protein [Bacteroides sp.]
MTIVHVIWQLTMGGVETMLIDIASAQTAEADVHIVAVNSPSNPEMLAAIPEGVSFHCCNRKAGSRSPLPLLKLNMLLLKLRPDVVHTHFGKLYKYIFHRPRLFVRTVHNTTNDISEIARYDRCFAISRAVVDEWKAAGHDIPMILNGIKCGAINHEPAGYNDGKLHMVQVSRLFVKQKGQDLILEALAMLFERQPTLRERIMMHFIGDGPDEEMLRQLTRSLGLEKNVTFEGLRDRKWVYAHLHEFDLYIQPSRFEGFGLTVAEACAARIPVLVSDSEGPLEILDGGRLGMTFTTGSAESLATQLERFITHGYPARLIDEAYAHTLERFDVSRTAAEYTAAYRAMLQTPSSPRKS